MILAGTGLSRSHDLEVEVVHLGVGVGVRTIETDTFQCGGDEAEVALIGQFYAQQVGVAGVFGLGDFLYSLF